MFPQVNQLCYFIVIQFPFIRSFSSFVSGSGWCCLFYAMQWQKLKLLYFQACFLWFLETNVLLGLEKECLKVMESLRINKIYGGLHCQFLYYHRYYAPLFVYAMLRTVQVWNYDSQLFKKWNILLYYRQKIEYTYCFITEKETKNPKQKQI